MRRDWDPQCYRFYFRSVYHTEEVDEMSNKGASIYDILVFSFAHTRTADAVVNELKASQKLGGYKVEAEAVVNSMREVSHYSCALV